mmetsp:Transcript_22952/g.49998  ORF Transcript_22952/g.49998 Transcript_22952/m.49998 type:complete len:106 (-) Transcript_22952:1455-1772(-)
MGKVVEELLPVRPCRQPPPGRKEDRMAPPPQMVTKTAVRDAIWMRGSRVQSENSWVSTTIDSDVRLLVLVVGAIADSFSKHGPGGSAHGAENKTAPPGVRRDPNR